MVEVSEGVVISRLLLILEELFRNILLWLILYFSIFVFFFDLDNGDNYVNWI